MADNFLEKHYEEYEARKSTYLRKKRCLPKQKSRFLERPEDEAL
ncbi:MAG: dehydrogenase [Prevotella sp.]|nr:dehydrogenase [Prevotella sp.]